MIWQIWMKNYFESFQRIDSSRLIQGTDGKWRGLNGADSLIAERFNAEIIATNDDGFKGTTSYVNH